VTDLLLMSRKEKEEKEKTAEMTECDFGDWMTKCSLTPFLPFLLGSFTGEKPAVMSEGCSGSLWKGPQGGK
jgi:hypothetical protein